MTNPSVLAAGLSILVLLSLGIVTYSNYEMARQAKQLRTSAATTTTTTTTTTTATTAAALVLATCMTTPLVPTQANLQLTFSQTGVDGPLSISGAAFGSAVPAGATMLLVYNEPCADVTAGIGTPVSPALVNSGPTSTGGAVPISETSTQWSVVPGGSRPLLLGSAVQLVVDGVGSACCEVTAG